MASATLRIKSKIFPATKKMREAGIKAKAAIRLYIGDSENCLVELNNFMIRARNSDGKLFIAPPQESYTDGNGDKKYFQLVRMAPDEKYDEEGGLREEFERAVMSAYKRAMDRKDGDDEPRRERRRDDDEPRRRSRDEEPRRERKRDDWDDEPKRESRQDDEDLKSSKDDDEDDWL